MKNLTNRIVGSVTVLSLALSAAMTAQGSISFSANGGGDYTASYSVPTTIPDNNPSGVAYDLNFSASGLSVANITVALNISGGYNGDLYAYLANPSGNVLVLLDRVGVSSTSTYGYGDPGYQNLTLSDSGASNIHNYGGNGGTQVPAGTYYG